MAHELTQRADGKVEMAYTGVSPWHGLGHALPAGQSIETWQVAAGMDWQVKRSRVRYGDGPSQRVFDGAHVLFRSDTKAPLGVVSPQYKIVHPGEVLEFFRDIAATQGARLETAGTLFGGRRFWALANLGESETVHGDDKLTQYLLLTSSADGSIATEARETVIRAVCNNTVSAALSARTKHAIRMTHRSVFDPARVKVLLAETKGHFAAFVEAARALARVTVHSAAAEKFVAELLRETTTRDDARDTPAYRSILALFGGSAMGGALPSAEGSAWGLVNAVTEYVDHKARASTDEHRVVNAWFGRGDALKTKAVEMALALV